MNLKMKIGKTRQHLSTLQSGNENRDYLVSCLVALSIEKAKEDPYSAYTKYWEDKFNNLDTRRIISMIKMDFQYLDNNEKRKVRNVIEEINEKNNS